MKYKLLIALLLIIITGYVGYSYLYQDHRDIAKEKPSYSISSEEFLTSFLNDTATATEKFLNKTIEITGKVTAVEKGNITINNQVYIALLTPATPTDLLNKEVVVKARCIGYDDLLEEVKFDQGTVLK